MPSSALINIKPEALEKLLQRHLMCQFVEQLHEQKTPFEHGEQLVVVGSALPMIRGRHQRRLAPSGRMPTDLDFYVRQPQGEIITRESKMALSETSRILLRDTAATLDATLSAPEGEYIGNQTYWLERNYTTQEINDWLARPESHEFLCSAYRAPSDARFKLSEPPSDKKIRAEIHFIAYPLSFLEPKPFESLAPLDDKVPVLRDDTDNFIAMKLARLMMPLPHNDLSGRIVEKAGDIMDIADTLEQREKLGKAPPDLPFLKVLVLAHLSYLMNFDTVGRVSTLRTDPNAQSDLRPLMDRDMKGHMDKLARQINMERGQIFNPDTPAEWEDFRNKPAYAYARRVTERTDGLMQQLFPERGYQNPLPLSDAERTFVYNLRKELMEVDYDLEHPSYKPVAAIETLAAAYPEVFAQHPNLRRDIENCWLTRPHEGHIEFRAQQAASLVGR